MKPLNLCNISFCVKVLFSGYLLVIAIGYGMAMAFVFMLVVSLYEMWILPRKLPAADRRHSLFRD